MTGEEGNDKLFGGLHSDELYGGNGNDFLDGGRFADYLEGGRGNDIYIVDNQGDKVVEYYSLGLGGNDTVQSSINYTLNANVENLILTETANTGLGNTLNNILVGNASNNTLNGGNGNDILYGKYGNDTLNGGAGDDVYVFDAGNGIDTITASEGFNSIIFLSGIGTSSFTLISTVAVIQDAWQDYISFNEGIDFSAYSAESGTITLLHGGGDSITFDASFDGTRILSDIQQWTFVPHPSLSSEATVFTLNNLNELVTSVQAIPLELTQLNTVLDTLIL